METITISRKEYEELKKKGWNRLWVSCKDKKKPWRLKTWKNKRVEEN